MVGTCNGLLQICAIWLIIIFKLLFLSFSLSARADWLCAALGLRILSVRSAGGCAYCLCAVLVAAHTVCARCWWLRIPAVRSAGDCA